MARPSDAGSTGASALGYIKSHESTVHIDFRLAPPEVARTENLVVERPGRKHRKAAKEIRKAHKAEDFKDVSLELHQDLGTLSREQGDTGTPAAVD